MFRSLYIWFWGLFGNVDWFDVFEIFGDLINLLLQFGRDQGKDFLNTYWGRLVYRFVVSVEWWRNLWSKFHRDFLSKGVQISVSYEWIPFGLIDRGNEIPDCLSDTIEILKVIRCQDRRWWTLFYFLFSSLFYFSFLFYSHVLFLKQLGLGFISHAVTSVTNWWRSHQTDHGTWENGVEGTRIKWRYTAWTTHAGLM